MLQTQIFVYTIIMSGRKNSPIVVSNDENVPNRRPARIVIVLSNSEPQSVLPVPAIRVGNKYQAVIPKFVNRVNVNNREDVLVDPETVINREKCSIASFRDELARFLKKYPRATQQAENEAKRTGMHRFVKRVKKSGSKQVYEWKIMLYRGG